METLNYSLTINITREILERSAMCGKDMPTELLIEKNVYPTNCAIALAVRDVLPMAKVQAEFIDPFGELSGMGLLYRGIALPCRARLFIELFDKAEPEERVKMQPFSFDVIIPDWVIERIDISEVTKLLENHPTLKLQTA